MAFCAAVMKSATKFALSVVAPRGATDAARGATDAANDDAGSTTSAEALRAVHAPRRSRAAFVVVLRLSISSLVVQNPTN